MTGVSKIAEGKQSFNLGIFLDILEAHFSDFAFSPKPQFPTGPQASVGGWGAGVVVVVEPLFPRFTKILITYSIAP